MSLASSWLARHRAQLAAPAVVAALFVVQPASAAGDPSSASVNAANQALHQAQAEASGTDQALSAAQTELASASSQLTALDQHIQSLNVTIAADTATVASLQQQLGQDRAHLADYLRQSYEDGGSEAALVYIISASDIAGAIQRKVQLDHVASAAQALVTRIDSEATQATRTLAQDDAARTQLSAAEQQARTMQALIAVHTEQVQQADVAAHQAVGQAQANLSTAQAQLAAAQAAAQAALNSERSSNVVFTPVPGGDFSVDTDLTKPSGETAANINAFLQGTPMQGLGESFMHAEATYHVSARYFVAHAILESDWGQSAIAQDKHNLFGFNADDRNPYGDASSFSSFDACIQYVAHFIATNYLSPSGPFFHGPTLRGMNVDYASDPLWAEKIASIARTIP